MARYLSITELGEPQLDIDVRAPVRLWRISGLAAVTGVVAGFIDFALTRLIYLITNLSYAHTWSFAQRDPAQIGVSAWVILLTTGGALLVGIMETFGSRNIRGGGIAATQEAVLLRGSRMAGNVALWKPLATAISIGTGSPLGREGPTIQSSGALSDLLGTFFGLTEPERRILLGCATAAGMAATYRTAVSAVLLAIEIVLFEVRSRSFIPLLLAAAGAAAVSVELAGPGMLVRVPRVEAWGPLGALAWYGLFGIGCGLLAAGVAYSVAGAKWLFKRALPRTILQAAAGGAAVGLIGWLMPAVLGSGYSVDSQIFHGSLAVTTLGALAPLKLLAFVVAIGAGLSGGMLSPTLMIGASMGTLFAHGINSVMPGAHLNATAFSLAGAGAVFGAASRAPLTFTVLTLQLANDSRALVPLTLVNVVATGVAFLLLRDPLQAQRVRAGQH